MSYYNTTNLEGSELKHAWSKNATQDELVLAVFLTCLLYTSPSPRDRG